GGVSPFARFHSPDGDPGGGGGGNGGGGAEPTVADLQRQLTDLQGKFGTLKTERDDLAGKVKGFEDAGRTDAEKQQAALTAAQKERDDALSSAKETRVRIEVERAARKLDAVDEDVVFRLLDTSAIQFDKDGKPTNVAALVEQLVKDK